MQTPERALFLAPLLALALGGAPRAVDDDFAAAAASFARTVVRASLDERKAALEALLAFEDPEALPVLAGEFARVSSKLRRARDEAFRARYALERQLEMLERMKLSAADGRGTQDALGLQQKRIDELREELERQRADVADLEPWFEVLGAGTGGFFEAIGRAARKQAEKELWAEVEAEGTELEARLAAIELIGFCGSEGTAVSLQKLIVELAGESAKLRRKLPKLMIEVRKFEQRMQKEQEQLEGKMSLALKEQYERATQEASDLQRRVSLLAFLSDAAVEAGGRALAREDGGILAKSLQTLLRAQKKAEDGARRRTLRMLARSGHERATAELRALLALEQEAAARAAVIDALAEGGDQAFVPLLLGELLSDESWHVKGRAAAALAKLRVRDAVPVLIERLALEGGRTRTDFQQALVSLTGEDFHTNVELWRRWWAEKRETFRVPEPAELEEKATEEVKESVGVTFFGIRTDSRRVLFVLDLSGSMTFSMTPHDNPDDDPNKPYDMPREGEISRLTAAKRALTKAIGGIEDGSVFNVVFYASDVWTWSDKLVVMDDETRSQAMRLCESLNAVGATNIYGALQMALELSGAKGGDEWSAPAIDTIFFLSDGRATVGLSTGADEILAFVRDLNATAGIVIHTIGLSGAQDAYLLRNLAEQNGGTYAAR